MKYGIHDSSGSHCAVNNWNINNWNVYVVSWSNEKMYDYKQIVTVWMLNQKLKKKWQVSPNL